jgi:hypothetical protein
MPLAPRDVNARFVSETEALVSWIPPPNLEKISNRSRKSPRPKGKAPRYKFRILCRPVMLPELNVALSRFRRDSTGHLAAEFLTSGGIELKKNGEAQPEAAAPKEPPPKTDTLTSLNQPEAFYAKGAEAAQNINGQSTLPPNGWGGDVPLPTWEFVDFRQGRVRILVNNLALTCMGYIFAVCCAKKLPDPNDQNSFVLGPESCLGVSGLVAPAKRAVIPPDRPDVLSVTHDGDKGTGAATLA